MASFYSDENCPLQVVEALRALGHDVLTAQEAAQTNRSIPDERVLEFVHDSGRALLTLNRWHFIALHSSHPDHAGLFVCSADPDSSRQATAIDAAVR